jgi:hypothetical protein
MNKALNNGRQNITQRTKDWATRTPLKSMVSLDPDPLVVPVMLLLLTIRRFFSVG